MNKFEVLCRLRNTVEHCDMATTEKGNMMPAPKVVRTEHYYKGYASIGKKFVSVSLPPKERIIPTEVLMEKAHG